ncbi:sulfatase-like hydrolase/transferase, partial [bacterium]|nr:sulfatase-like hydrolase/transferase [bacterium]
MRVDKFLVVSIDCWRYDALSRTHPLLNTPKFDLLTRDYALAERYFVTAPATRPSHSSLFSGLYPFEHGLYGQTYLKTFEGVANLFQVFDAAGYSVRGFSERPDVFRFLDFESYVGPVDPDVTQQHMGALERLAGALIEPDDVPQFKFLHFWYTHGGYGLGGIPDTPNLRQMVDEGRTAEALRYYYAAVTHVLEFA